MEKGIIWGSKQSQHSKKEKTNVTYWFVEGDVVAHFNPRNFIGSLVCSTYILASVVDMS
jgi:hypothetical protein